MKNQKNERQWCYCEYTTTSFINFQNLWFSKEKILKTIDTILKKDGTKNTTCFEKYTGIDCDKLVNIWCRKEKKAPMKSVDLIIGINNQNNNKNKKYTVLIENKYNVISTKSMRSFSELKKRYEDSTTVLIELSRNDILNGYIPDDINITQTLVVLAKDDATRNK